jgi:hypothetical protein
VYPSQILAIRKSPSVDVELGQEIESTIAYAHPRQKSFIGYMILMAHWIKGFFIRKNNSE